MLAYETDWREKLDALSNATRLGLLCLGIVVLTLVMLVVAASIRLTTLSVQPQMKALYLFGASPSFAMRPIAWRGFILMMSASLGAIAITYAGLAVLGHPIATVARLYEVELALALPPVDWCAGFVIICSLIGYITALLFGSGRLAKGPPLTLFRETEHTFFSGLGAPIGATIQSFPNFRLRLTHK